MIIAAIAATVLENARHLQRLEKENQWLRDEVNLQHAMVGESPRMHEIYQFVAKVAASDPTILLLGESGTGKELVARHSPEQSAQPPALRSDQLRSHYRDSAGERTLRRESAEHAPSNSIFV